MGAVVASVNSTFTKFISMADFHSNMSEMTDRMCPSIAKALNRYNSLNGCLPERVIMYRYVICFAPYYLYNIIISGMVLAMVRYPMWWSTRCLQ